MDRMANSLNIVTGTTVSTNGLSGVDAWCSRTNIAALFVILFIYGWNQYLWPLLITTDESYYTVVMGIQRMVSAAEQLPVWNHVMATAMLAMLPPALIVILMQRQFIKGLIETEK